MLNDAFDSSYQTDWKSLLRRFGDFPLSTFTFGAFDGMLAASGASFLHRAGPLRLEKADRSAPAGAKKVRIISSTVVPNWLKSLCLSVR